MVGYVVEHNSTRGIAIVKVVLEGSNVRPHFTPVKDQQVIFLS